MFRLFSQSTGNQTKTNRSWSHASGAYWRRLHTFASDSDWLVVLFTSVVIGQSKITLVLVLRYSIENHSILLRVYII